MSTIFTFFFPTNFLLLMFGYNWLKVIGAVRKTVAKDLTAVQENEEATDTFMEELATMLKNLEEQEGSLILAEVVEVMNVIEL